jgi:hypothetical protein
MSTLSNLNLNAEAYTPAMSLSLASSTGQARPLSPSAKPYRPGKPMTVDEDWEVLEKAIGLVLENMPRDRIFRSNWNLPKVSRFA